MKIEIEHVSKKIKDALVLDDVCMTLESGNIYGFQGVNGSGKTMLMRQIVLQIRYFLIALASYQQQR